MTETYCDGSYNNCNDIETGHLLLRYLAAPADPRARKDLRSIGWSIGSGVMSEASSLKGIRVLR